jgi:two-component system, LuxR family, sensor kinase FixL
LSTTFGKKIPSFLPLASVWALLVLTAFGGSLWISRILHSATPQGSLAIAIGAASAILVSVLGGAVLLWRRRFLNKLSERVMEGELAAKKIADLTQVAQTAQRERNQMLEELRKFDVELEKRLAARTALLSKNCAELQAELNERKQAEKALAQQAQELGRSKDVLELHVQARTQELQKLRHRYESILNSAGEGIYGLDIQGRTTFVNPAAAKLTGWRVEELIGKPESDVFWKGSVDTALVTRGEHPGEQIFYRKDGSSFAVEYVRTPIMEKEKLIGAVVIFKDITERKRTHDALARKAAELARSNAELEQFAYVASHDLQEPLRKIQAFGDRLKSKLETVNLQEGQDYLERMQSAAARMQRLINDLLTFSRVISKSQPFVPVDLAQVTKEVLGDLEVRIEQTKAHVDLGALPTIEADPTQMRQLLQNLIGNALKFQPPNAKPQIHISAQNVRKAFNGVAEGGIEQELCEVTIKDNGIGFDEKYSEKIFAMFQRLHGRNEYEGTGVGLAVCRRITDRHGGTISAKSKPGEGATFVVTLPVAHQKGDTEL